MREKIVDNIFAVGESTLLDKICPSEIIFSNPSYVKSDGVYSSGILITDYCRMQETGWINPLFNLEFDTEISMFYEKQDTSTVIKELTYHIGNFNSAMKTVSNNQRDIDIISTSYEDAKYIRNEMQINKEELYRLHIYISVFDEDKEKLNFNLQKLEGICGGMGLQTRRAIFRQEQVYKSILPCCINDKDIAKSCARNVLTQALTSTYPFVSSELCDTNGIIIGNNENNQSLVIIDRFESSLYKNANMCILGTSGSGKSFLTKLMIIRNRLFNITQFVIDPDREYDKVCKELSGTLIRIGPASKDYINILAISEEDSDEGIGYLSEKLGRLNIFFNLIFKEMSQEEKVMLEEKIIKCYEEKGISFDDESLYCNDNKIRIKKKFKSEEMMPLLGDLYNILKEDRKTKRMAGELKPYINGSLKFFNEHTNVKINNKLVVADINDLNGDTLPVAMFLITETFWRKIKYERSQKKILYIDEMWRLMTSENTADFIYKIFKTIRKYGGGATAITQDISDFFTLEEGKYGKSILNNSAIKFILQLEEEDVKTLGEVLKLSQEEMEIKNFDRGVSLLYAGSNHVTVKIKAYDNEYELITTDRKDLEKTKKKVNHKKHEK